MNIEKKKLYRSRDNRMIAGVCGGLGEYFGIDATLVRLAFVLGMFFLAIPGALAFVYLIMMIVIPEEPEFRGTEIAKPAETRQGEDIQNPIDTEL